MDTCVFPGCGRPHYGHGLCNGHYAQQRKGRPLSTLRGDLPATCAFPGCERPRKSRGYCDSHYAQLRKGKPLVTLTPKHQYVVCQAPECDRAPAAHGLCTGHYDQQRKGRPLAPLRPREKSLSERMAFHTTVDNSNGCHIWTGTLSRSGYARIKIGGRSGKTLQASRVAYEQANGQIPNGYEIDHICHNPKCVNPTHLRLATRSQNTQYTKGVRADNNSGFPGVSPRRNGWAARWVEDSRGRSKAFSDIYSAAAYAARMRLRHYDRPNRERDEAIIRLAED